MASQVRNEGESQLSLVLVHLLLGHIFFYYIAVLLFSVFKVGLSAKGQRA